MSPDSSQPQSNLERLLKNLPGGSLARRLAEAYKNPQGVTPTEATRACLRQRLEQVRAELANPKA